MCRVALSAVSLFQPSSAREDGSREPNLKMRELIYCTHGTMGAFPGEQHGPAGGSTECWWGTVAPNTP